MVAQKRKKNGNGHNKFFLPRICGAIKLTKDERRKMYVTYTTILFVFNSIANTEWLIHKINSWKINYSLKLNDRKAIIVNSCLYFCYV